MDSVRHSTVYNVDSGQENASAHIQQRARQMEGMEERDVKGIFIEI